MRQLSERGLPSVSILIFSHFVQTVLTSRLLFWAILNQMEELRKWK